MLVHTVPHGIYRGSSWPPVIACAFRGCVMRAPADRAPDGWTCRDHRDPYADAHVEAVVADVLAEQSHRVLVEPTATTYTDPPRERRYVLRSSPRLDPDWRPGSDAA